MGIAMELTSEHYRQGEVAYEAFCTQAGGRSLISGEALPEFSVLKPLIQDAWAAAAIAVGVDLEMSSRATPPAPQLIDGFPRRNRIDLMAPAELAIRYAVDVVEGLAADARLTKAVILLAEARERVADYIESPGA